MTFGAPGMLGLLALLPVVVLLHLRRRREVTVGSLVVWHRIAHALDKRSTRIRNLTVSASLILQLLVVAAFVLALAQPLFGAEDSTDHLIAVLDSSIAMRFVDVAPDRFEAARSELVAATRTVRTDALISIVIVEDRSSIELARHGNDASVESALASLRASDAPADWVSATIATAPLVHPNENTQIVVFTAIETRSVASNAFAAAFPTADVGTVAFGERSPIHAGLTDVDAVLRGATEGSWAVTGRLVGVGLPREPVRIEAYVRPRGTEGLLSWSVTEATPDASGEATFSLELDVPGPSILELRLPEGADPLPSDDRVLVELRTTSAVRVLWVGPDHPALERALLAIPDLALDRASHLPEDADTYDLVILDGFQSAAVPATSTIWFGAGPWTGSPLVLADPTPTGWLSDHVLTAGMDAGSLTIGSALDLPVLAGADVLIESAGAPLLQARTTDLGRQVVVAFDVRQSNWPGQAAFPAFVAAIVDWATPDRRLTELASCAVGRACGLPRRAFTPDWRVLGPEGDVELEPTAFLPYDDDPFATGVWPGASYDAQFRPRRAGLYQLDFAAEATLIPVSAVPWTDPVADHNEPDNVTHTSDWSANDLRRALSLAPLLLGLGTALLVIEAIRAGRGSERFLRPAAFVGTIRRRRSLVVGTLSTLSLIAAALALQPAPWPAIVSRTAVAGIAPVDADEVTHLRRIDALVQYADGPETNSSNDSPRLVSELNDALELAVAMLPNRENATIHVETVQDEPFSAASFVELSTRLAAAGVKLVIHVARATEEADPRLERGLLPQRIRAGDTISAVLFTQNGVGNPADLEVILGDAVVYDEPVLPGGGRHVVTFQAPTEPGIHALDLRLVDAAGDPIWTNQLGLEVGPSAQVLLLSSQTAASARLAELLELQGLDVTVMLPRRMPVTLERLSVFDVTILLDVAAAELQTGHQELLETWVGARGGGLVILGGEQTFGAGGYFRTPIEDLSPLSARIPDELPVATLIFVLDRSGSMQAPVGTGTRLDIAKQATVEAFELLAPESRIGIVAFDAVAETIAPITPLTERGAIEAAVGSVRVGGGTAIYPALVHARDLLVAEVSPVRHIIVITDGLSQPGDFEGILADLRASSVTVSFIGIGDGADGAQLARLAELGGGSFHLTRDVRGLPSIMSQEAMQLASDPVENGQIRAAWMDPRPEFLYGIEGDPPALEGYIRTSAKPEATVHLADSTGDVPLLASWRYGLGRVIAFASQPVGPWSRNWNADEDLRALWSQIARWTAGDVRRAGLTLEVQPVGSRLNILVDAVDEGRLPLEGLVVRAELIDRTTGEALHMVRLLESRPGQYDASIRIDGEPSEYDVRAMADTGEKALSERTVMMPALLTGMPTLDTGGTTLSSLASVVARSYDDETHDTGVPWRLTHSPSRRAWGLVAIACYMLSLAARYRPSLFPGRRETITAVGPPTAAPQSGK